MVHLKHVRMLLGALAVLAFCAGVLQAHPAVAQTPVAAAPTIVQIGAHTEAQVNALVALVDIWEVDRAHGLVIAAADDATVVRLRAQGWEVTVDTARTQAAREPAISAAAAGDAQGGSIPGFACYRTVEQTWADMAALAATHPRLAQWVDYGDSWDKATPAGPAGYDLHALVITNRDKPGPKFPYVVIASVHARELATAEVAARFAEQLVSSYGNDPTITWLLDYGAIYVVPMANPDGRKFAEQLLYWRKNTHDIGACFPGYSPFGTYGVDLNRNSSFAWGACTAGGCSSTDPCNLTYRGSGPASEPETQALQALLAGAFADQRGPGLTDVAPVDSEGLFISLHSYGQLVLYPWGFTDSPAPNAAGLQALGDKFGAYTGYRTCQGGAPGCLYATDGTNDDWAYGTLGVASYTFEMGTDFFESCTAFEATIKRDVTDALVYGATAARRPYAWPQAPAAVAGSVLLTPTRIMPGDALTLTITFAAPGAQFGDEKPTSAATDIVTGATAWLDTPPWLDATGIPFTALDGAFDGAQESAAVAFDTSTWALGRHTLFWSAASADGAGVPGAIFVNVGDAPTADPEAPEPPVAGGRVFLPILGRSAPALQGGR